MNLLNKKRGLIIGVANERSAAWGIAKYAFENGADLAFTYQLDTFKKRVEPLAKSLNSDIVIECDVSKNGSIKNAFEHLKYFWNNIEKKNLSPEISSNEIDKLISLGIKNDSCGEKLLGAGGGGFVYFIFPNQQSKKKFKEKISKKYSHFDVNFTDNGSEVKHL